MKNKKKLISIIIAIVLIIILIISSILIFNNKRNYRQDIKYAYICEQYNNKFYSSNNLQDSDCEKIDFKCKNCEIYPIYKEDKIIYETGKNKLIIYDLKKQKVIDKIKVQLTEQHNQGNVTEVISVNPMEQDGVTFGFSYWDTKDDYYFYNLNNNKNILIEAEAICDYELDGIGRLPSELCDNPCVNGYCGKSGWEIHNDKIIIKNENNQYGIFNLKTGKNDLNFSQNYIIYDNYETYNEEKETYDINGYYLLEYNILDKNLEPVFENDLKVHPIKMISNELIVAYDEALDLELYLIFFNANGEEIYRISLDVIGYEVYKKIENKSLKNSTDVRTIAESLENNINISYEDDIINLNFYYQNEEYNEYIDLYYKYHIKSKYLEEYEIDYEDGC